MDSMQVYRGMDIGTAKPTPSERAEVPHHLIDVVDPNEEWALPQHLGAARAALAAIEGRGRRAVLVGGTGLYVHALVDGFIPPGRWPEIHAELDGDPDTPALHQRLAELDPLAASRMEPTNRRRVLRALEVTLGSGHPFSSFGPGMGTYPPTPWCLVGLARPPAEIATRISTRFDSMMAAGLLGEVRRLAGSDGGWSRTAAQALGYRELLAHLRGQLGLAEAVEAAIGATRAFAKRQRAWWRRDPRIRWYEAGENTLELVSSVLGDWAPT
jgi:tRNA dimethylallyltransferase